MILCKDCKWWELTDGQWMPDFGDCNHPKFHIGYQTKRKDITDDSIVIECDEGWGCFTGPNFGCIHGIEKEVKP